MICSEIEFFLLKNEIVQSYKINYVDPQFVKCTYCKNSQFQSNNSLLKCCADITSYDLLHDSCDSYSDPEGCFGRTGDDEENLLSHQETMKNNSTMMPDWSPLQEQANADIGMIFCISIFFFNLYCVGNVLHLEVTNMVQKVKITQASCLMHIFRRTYERRKY